MRLHIVAGWDASGENPVVLHASSDGEVALAAYWKAMEDAKYATITYSRRVPFNKRAHPDGKVTKVTHDRRRGEEVKAKEEKPSKGKKAKGDKETEQGSTLEDLMG